MKGETIEREPGREGKLKEVATCRVIKNESNGKKLLFTDIRIPGYHHLASLSLFLMWKSKTVSSRSSPESDRILQFSFLNFHSNILIHSWFCFCTNFFVPKWDLPRPWKKIYTYSFFNDFFLILHNFYQTWIPLPIYFFKKFANLNKLNMGLFSFIFWIWLLT